MVQFYSSFYLKVLREPFFGFTGVMKHQEECYSYLKKHDMWTTYHSVWKNNHIISPGSALISDKRRWLHI